VFSRPIRRRNSKSSRAAAVQAHRGSRRCGSWNRAFPKRDLIAGNTRKEIIMLNLQTAMPSLVVNTTTKAELLSRAKAAIEAGEQSLWDATVRDN
jgi:hypothetical protein